MRKTDGSELQYGQHEFRLTGFIAAGDPKMC
jgi:hypothetical protein